MKYLYFIVQFLFLINLFKYLFYNINIDTNSQLMKKILEVDYKIYKECVKRTNMITCGRNISTIQKHNKPSPLYRKKFILPSTKCKVTSKAIKSCNKRDILIVVGIGTGAEYFYERYVYRLYYRRFNYINYYFFMGLSENNTINNKIYEENKVYKDMIIFSFLSSYFNLTSQVICTLNWISSNCNSYKWYIHHTSDSYINIKKIYKYLIHYKECNCVIGYIKENVPVDQNRNSVFYIPYHVINIKVYPKFPNGPGYFLHKNAINEICQNIEKSTPKIWMDDVFIGLVISHTHISVISLNEYFHMNGKIRYEEVNNYFLIHNLSPSEIFFLSSTF